MTKTTFMKKCSKLLTVVLCLITVFISACTPEVDGELAASKSENVSLNNKTVYSKTTITTPSSLSYSSEKTSKIMSKESSSTSTQRSNSTRRAPSSITSSTSLSKSSSTTSSKTTNVRSSESSACSTSSRAQNLADIADNYTAYIVAPSSRAEEIYQEIKSYLPSMAIIQAERENSFKEFVARYYNPDFHNENPDESVACEGNPFSNCDIPYYIQWDQRWGFKPYAASTIAQSGCGPTCMSMVYTGLTGEVVLPDEMSEFSKKKGYAIDHQGTSWLLMSQGAETLGLKYKIINSGFATIATYLEADCPIIAHVKPGKLSSVGHFIVLRDVYFNKLKIYDPFSLSNSLKLWNYEELNTEINALWAYKAK